MSVCAASFLGVSQGAASFLGVSQGAVKVWTQEEGTLGFRRYATGGVGYAGSETPWSLLALLERRLALTSRGQRARVEQDLIPSTPKVPQAQQE